MPLISSFDAAQKEARTLLHTLQQKDAMSTERYASFYGTEVFPPRLSDAQYLVARRYGFKSWTTLKAHLTSRLTRKTLTRGEVDSSCKDLRLNRDQPLLHRKQDQVGVTPKVESSHDVILVKFHSLAT